jgi:hypothetical protein
MPVFWHLKMKRPMGLHNPMSDGLCNRINDMVMQMAGLVVVPVAANKWKVFSLFIFEAHFPTTKKFRPRVNVGQFLILIGSFQLSTHHVFETIVGDNVMVCALVLHRYSLLHQTSFFELITIDE